MKRHRIWAAIISVFILFIAVVGLVSLLIYSVTDQIRLANFDDIISLAKEYMKSLEAFYNSILNGLENLDIQSSQLEQYVRYPKGYLKRIKGSFAEGLVNSITNISGYLTTIIFASIIGFYFIIDGRCLLHPQKSIICSLFKRNSIIKYQ